MHVPAQALITFAMGAAAIAAGSGAVRACNEDVHYTYNAPVEIEGALKSGTGHHEAQGDFAYTHLVLDKGVCVDAPKDGGDDDFGNTGTENPVERIQIAGEASQQALPLGERVKVKGTLFGAHTMWHVEEVLIDASSVERR
jgi:hypothetical protein